MNRQCQLESELKQCCCNCKYHLPDYFHCSTAPAKRDKKGSCICSEQRGWVCAGFAPEQVFSHWPKHSVGCELYTPKEPV